MRCLGGRRDATPLGGPLCEGSGSGEVEDWRLRPPPFQLFAPLQNNNNNDDDDDDNDDDDDDD